MPLQSAYILNRSVHLAIKENLKMVKKWVSYADLNFLGDLYQLTPSYQLTPVYGNSLHTRVTFEMILTANFEKKKKTANIEKNGL